jgi:predicted  nucleic acid-binding Zn-ribbon protein
MSTPASPILKELHRLRRHLRDLQSEIDLGPRVMKLQQQKLEAEQQAHNDAHGTLKRLKIQLKEDEVSLKATEQRLLKLAADMNLAGSKKEYDAKQSEINQANGKKGEFEDAILTGMSEVEERTAGLPGVEKRWADAQAEFEQNQADARERLERLVADQKATQAELAETEKKLPPEIKGPYDRLVKSYGADALAAVVGRSCQHCRTAITEQQRLNLLGGAFMACSQCARILYLVEGTS